MHETLPSVWASSPASRLSRTGGSSDTKKLCLATSRRPTTARMSSTHRGWLYAIAVYSAATYRFASVSASWSKKTDLFFDIRYARSTMSGN